PAWNSTPQDFTALYPRCIAEIPTRGYGVFSRAHMFTLAADDTLRPVKNPDPQQLDTLIGYERERAQVIANTEALLAGHPANNILLYGDAGTGKSSTVKALANHFKGKGLRLVEVRKTQLGLIPRLMDTLGDNPLKFLLFIDDLSFAAHDTNFTQLKAVLEGSVVARPQNVVVYATSNRRHFINETFSQRQGDDVHAADTREEEASLAARFGITVTFLKPNRALYAQIVRAYAKQHRLELNETELLAQAEQYAIKQGGRTPRAAKQFVESAQA
ncbi:MAG: ATP-binding protein, partial [Coriobacteriales bacterium]|nr:ATP-binding protein [Coriobacteriales bacterium]